MNNQSKPTKGELVARVRAERQIILERVGFDSPRLEMLRSELNKLVCPLQVFSSLRKLWIRVEHPPFFTHEFDDHLEFIELQVPFLALETKRSAFRRRVAEAILLQHDAVDALPDVATLGNLEIPQLEQLVRQFDNDERFRNYLQCDVGKIQGDWNEENLHNLIIDLVQRMEGMMSVTTEKLRIIAQANANA